MCAKLENTCKHVCTGLQVQTVRTARFLAAATPLGFADAASRGPHVQGGKSAALLGSKHLLQDKVHRMPAVSNCLLNCRATSNVPSLDASSYTHTSVRRGQGREREGKGGRGRGRERERGRERGRKGCVSEGVCSHTHTHTHTHTTHTHTHPHTTAAVSSEGGVGWIECLIRM